MTDLGSINDLELLLAKEANYSALFSLFFLFFFFQK